MVGKVLSRPEDDFLSAPTSHQLDSDRKSIPAELPWDAHRGPTRRVGRRGELGNLFEVRYDFFIRLGRREFTNLRRRRADGRRDNKRDILEGFLVVVGVYFV